MDQVVAMALLVVLDKPVLGAQEEDVSAVAAVVVELVEVLEQVVVQVPILLAAQDWFVTAQVALQQEPAATPNPDSPVILWVHLPDLLLIRQLVFLPM